MRTLILVAKAPLPGFSKTRLAGGSLDPRSVARLADAFLRDTLRACERVSHARLVISYAPPGSEEHFRSRAPRAHLVPQREGDLGARLRAAFEAAFRLEAAPAVMIGSDTPHIGAERIERAFAALERADCALGPAPDGGYYLIGLREPRAALFEGIDWSTERVLAQTLARARSLGLSAELLDELSDIDRLEDLERLERSLSSDPAPCPDTTRALAEERAAGRLRPGFESEGDSKSERGVDR